jgi:hypothetical protein
MSSQHQLFCRPNGVNTTVNLFASAADALSRKEASRRQTGGGLSIDGDLSVNADDTCVNSQRHVAPSGTYPRTTCTKTPENRGRIARTAKQVSNRPE